MAQRSGTAASKKRTRSGGSVAASVPSAAAASEPPRFYVPHPSPLLRRARVKQLPRPRLPSALDTVRSVTSLLLRDKARLLATLLRTHPAFEKRAEELIVD